MRKSILTTALILIATVSAFSQTDTETRRIKTTAFQMYDNYKSVIRHDLNSQQPIAYDNFMNLFDKKALLYNDIIPANTPVQLSPENYFAKFKENIRRIDNEYSNFKIGEPVSVENKWQIQCSFTRETKLRTQNRFNYPKWVFHYIMTIEMDKTYNASKKVYEYAKIVNIEVENPLESFFIIENKENLPIISKWGDPIFDWDKDYQNRIFPKKQWNITDFLVPESNIFEIVKSEFTPNATDEHFHQPVVKRFMKDIFGAGVNYTYVWGNRIKDTTNVVNPEAPIVTKHTSVLSLSFFFGKQIFNKKKSILFANAGLDLNFHFHTLRHSKDTIQIDNNYKIVNTTKECNPFNFSLSVPLSVQYLYQLTKQGNRPVFLSFELGGFFEYTFSDSISIGFKYIDYATCHEYITPIDDFDFNKKNVLKQHFPSGGIFGGVGLWVALNNSSLLKINLSYKYNFVSPLKNTEGINMGLKDGRADKFLLYHLENGMHNIGFGVSWIKIINKKIPPLPH